MSSDYEITRNGARADGPVTQSGEHATA